MRLPSLSLFLRWARHSKSTELNIVMPPLFDRSRRNCGDLDVCTPPVWHRCLTRLVAPCSYALALALALAPQFITSMISITQRSTKRSCHKAGSLTRYVRCQLEFYGSDLCVSGQGERPHLGDCVRLGLWYRHGAAPLIAACFFIGHETRLYLHRHQKSFKYGGWVVLSHSLLFP